MAGNEYTIVLLEDGQEITTIRSEKQVESMVKVAEFLATEYNLIENIELPYTPGRKEKPIVEEIPGGKKEAPRQKHEFSEGYFIDTLANKSTKKREIRRIANACGLNVDFQGAWN